MHYPIGRIQTQRAIRMDQQGSYSRLNRCAQIRHAARRTAEETHFCLHRITSLRRFYLDNKRFDFRICGQRQIVYRQCRITEFTFPTQASSFGGSIPNIQGIDRLVQQTARRKNNHLILCGRIAGQP